MCEVPAQGCESEEMQNVMEARKQMKLCGTVGYYTSNCFTSLWAQGQ